MSIFTIGDLHLSFNSDKPMNIFGDNWINHENKIKENWIEKVKQEDYVILPGDFSWEMYLEDTIQDFKFLESLPGKKILLKGNHDYWWTTLKKMKDFLIDKGFQTIDFIYNNSYLVENKIIVGTRGWNLSETENGEKMIKRESNRLEISIQDGIKRYGDDKEMIAFMHYPPITLNNNNSLFVQILKKYNIKNCYYAHLHGNSHKDAIEGEYNGINFKLISADYLDFNLIKI